MPAIASRAGVVRGSGRATVSAATASSTADAIPAISRGLSKNPPEPNASAVGPASTAAAARVLSGLRIGRQRSGADLCSAA